MSKRSIFYCHGYAVTPIIEPCHHHALFKLVNASDYRERTWLIQNLHANAGPFTIALDVLVSIGWIEKKCDAYRLMNKPLPRHGSSLASLYAVNAHEVFA